VIFSDILKDKNKYPDLSDDWRVVLATRSLDSVEISDSQAQVLDVGEFQVDEAAGEIDVMPSIFMPPGTSGITFAYCLELMARSPQFADFSLSGITGVKILADGGRAQRSNGIIGSYVLSVDKEYWLLLAPEAQWPAHWFGT